MAWAVEWIHSKHRLVYTAFPVCLVKDYHQEHYLRTEDQLKKAQVVNMEDYAKLIPSMSYVNYSSGSASDSTDGSNPHSYWMVGYQSSAVKGDYIFDLHGPANSSSRTSFNGRYQFIDTDGGWVQGSTTVDTAYDGYYMYPSAGGTISGTILTYGYGE